MAPSEVRKDEDGDKDVSRRPADVVKLLSRNHWRPTKTRDDESLKLGEDAALT